MTVEDSEAPTTPDTTASVVMTPSLAPKIMSGRYLPIATRSTLDSHSLIFFQAALRSETIAWATEGFCSAAGA